MSAVTDLSTLALLGHPHRMAAPHRRYEPIMSPLPDPARWRMWMSALVGALLLLFALLTVGQALYLKTNGVTAQATVIDAGGGRAAFVRVRLSSGREADLWAWAGSPRIGQTMSVVYLKDRNWAKDAGVFAPTWRLWLGFGMAPWFLGKALFDRTRSRAGRA
ncbi:hypothetical protein [Micromonospora sp. WMMD980]|uniref:hypothetical protein n=1 Tax=Micromonospora sp. WMMD980 TaxID=3016088 RepID=UPI002415D36A|nr:hypothetical protein [Micromonospora sp. WMMD980]MDG4801080.1 hypothetical protein [Micromonospora sp. WMMD980]